MQDAGFLWLAYLTPHGAHPFEALAALAGLDWIVDRSIDAQVYS